MDNMGKMDKILNFIEIQVQAGKTKFNQSKAKQAMF